MLACSHDLCLNCAAERLNFEMKKRKPANVQFNRSCRVSSVNSVTKEPRWMLKVSQSSKRWSPPNNDWLPGEATSTRPPNPNKSLMRSHHVLMKNPNTHKRHRHTRKPPSQQPTSVIMAYQAPTSKCWPAYPQEKHVANTSMKISFTSVSLANVSAFVQSVSFTVFYWFYGRKAQGPRRQDHQEIAPCR